MNELDPCLAGCDSALGEAERLLAMLAATGSAEESLAPVQASIARLRREVDRLRGLKVAPARRKTGPLWMQSSGGESPWPTNVTPTADPV